MPENRNILIQDYQGNNYYPHGRAKTSFLGDGTNVEDNIEEIKQSVESYIAENVIQTAMGTANAILINTGGDFKYIQGNKISFKAIFNSTSAVTIDIDGKGAKALKKLDGTNATIKAHKVYEVFYSTSDDCFFLLARTEGNAIAENVLAGKTFSNDDDTDIVGTMPNRGAVTITPKATDQTIAAGYHSGSGKVVGDADLAPENIKVGVDIFGVVGTHNSIDEVSAGSITELFNSNSINVQSSVHASLTGIYKQFTMQKRGSVRIAFNLATQNNSYSVQGRVYKNGLAAGTLRSTNAFGTVYTEDFFCEVGDVFQIYVKAYRDDAQYYTCNAVLKGVTISISESLTILTHD